MFLSLIIDMLWTLCYIWSIILISIESFLITICRFVQRFFWILFIESLPRCLILLCCAHITLALIIVISLVVVLSWTTIICVKMWVSAIPVLSGILSNIPCCGFLTPLSGSYTGRASFPTSYATLKWFRRLKYVLCDSIYLNTSKNLCYASYWSLDFVSHLLLLFRQQLGFMKPCPLFYSLF